MTKSEEYFVVDFGDCFHLTHALISQAAKKPSVALSHIQWNDEPNMWREVRRVEIEAIISEAKETDSLGPFLAEKYPLTQQMKSYVEVIGGQLVMKQAYLNQLFIDYPHSDCVVSASHEELPKRSLLQLVSKR